MMTKTRLFIDKHNYSSGGMLLRSQKSRNNRRKSSSTFRRFSQFRSLFLIFLSAFWTIPTVRASDPSIRRKLFRLMGLRRSNAASEDEVSSDEATDFWKLVAQEQQRQPATSSGPSSSSDDLWQDDEPLLLRSLKRLLEDPSEFLRSVGNGMKLGLAAYSIVLVWKMYTEISKALVSENFGISNSSEGNRSLIESLVKIFEEREVDEDTALNSQHAKLWEDGRSQQWIDLIQKLKASGMPLRSDDPKEASIVKVLPTLTKAEVSILHLCLIDPRTIDSSERIFGLEGELHNLDVMIGQLHGQQTSSKFGPLFGPAKKSFSWPGVLLYGPPGCGKSMLIRHATAQAEVPCLTLTPSLLLRKFVGESNLQVRALFTLISKLSPCILFIDEIDGLFRERAVDEHHVSREIKTEFLQYWDGLLSEKSVLVVGATNRPFDLDSAVLRRLPQCWFVDPPNPATRRRLWSHWLSQVPVETNINIDKLVQMTDGYTHSDIRHLLQVAALEGPMSDNSTDKISFEDIVGAMSSVSGSRSSDLYSRQLWSFIRKYDEILLKNAIEAWDTPDGRFYSLGTLNIDADAIRLIMEIVRELQDTDGTDDDMDDDDL